MIVANGGRSAPRRSGRRMSSGTLGLSVVLAVSSLVTVAPTATGAPGGTASRTFTSDADFGEGSAINVVPGAPGQLQLDDTVEAFNFIWVAVSSKGTIVRIDTETGAVLGEFRTAPEGQPTDPSRTTVDINGSVWATNRAGNSVVHVGLPENGRCVDRNGNGTIDTSTGLDDILAWPNDGGADTAGGVTTAADECILNYTRVSSSGTRHVSVTASNDVWVSGTGGQVFDLIDGDTGAIVRTEPSVGYGGYGGLIDANGVIWSARPLLRWDTANPLTGPNGGNWTGYGHDSYGLCIDSAGNVWDTDVFGSVTRKFAPDGSLLGTFPHGAGTAQGCVVDANDDVWVAHSHYGSTVGHLKNDGTFVGNVVVGSGPTGVAVDGAGKIWATNFHSRNVSRIDPALGPIGADGTTPVGEVDLTTTDMGGNLYNYSDMTGSTLTGKPDSGTWSVVYDSGLAGAEWGRIGWTADVVGDAALAFTAASSADGVSFGSPQAVTEDTDLSVADGRYLRITAGFTRAGTGETPVLYDVTVRTANEAPVATDDTASTFAGEALRIPAATLLANDTDADGDALTITAVTPGPDTHGTVTLDGVEVVYTPTAGYVGPAAFTYTVDDGHGATDTATVRIDVRELVYALSGGAYGERLRTTLLGLPFLSSGPMPEVILPPGGGGPITASLLSARTPLRIGTLAVSTEGQARGRDAYVASSARVANAEVRGLFARLVGLEAVSSECRSTPGGSTGRTTIGRLAIGMSVRTNVVPGPNTRIDVAGIGTLVLNEQVRTSAPGQTAITVNAAHLYLLAGSPLGSGDLVLAQSRCGTQRQE